MIDIRSVLLFISLVFSFGECQLENFPHYDELFNMVMTRFHSNSFDDFTQPIIDMKSIFNSTDNLDYQAQTFGSKYSDNPLVLSAAINSYQHDICGWFVPKMSMQCCTDIHYFLVSVVAKKLWAIKMIDSYGKIPSGVFLGDHLFPGAYDECLDLSTKFNPLLPIDASKPTNLFNPKYCQIGFHIPRLTSLYNPKGLLTIGICVPDSCTAADIKFFVNTAIEPSPFLVKDKKNTFACDEQKKFELQDICTVAVCGFIVLLVILGTIYDLISTQISKGQKADISDEQQSTPESLEMKDLKETAATNESTEELEPEQKTTGPGKLGKFLLCFSLYKNGLKLLDTDIPTDHLTSIHGLRFISMSWIILGQTYILGTRFWKNKTVLKENNMASFTFQAIGNATVATDSFFLISGILVVYIGLKAMEDSDGKMDWFYFYLHRFWRLTPTYMLVLMVYVPLMQFWGNGPYWPRHGVEENYCRHNWWQNLLYINNFFDKQCMGWMWYLANDMQFYIFSPFILILLNKKPYRGLILLTLLLIGQCTLTGFLWISKERDPTMEAPADIYMRPYTRMGPYLIGMAYGYLLRKNNGKVAINRCLNLLAWLLASGCAISVLYGLYGNYHGFVMTKELAAIYMAVHRSVWAVAIGWVIYACATGNSGFINQLLSWKGFIPLSRLTYCAYLVHPIVIYTHILRQRYPIYVTNFRAIHLYLAHLLASYLVAFVVSMVFESPMTALEKIFNKKK